jgi:hypothetical protein
MIITIQNKRKYKISLFRLWQVCFAIFAVLMIVFLPTLFIILQIVTSPFNILTLIMAAITFFIFTPFIQMTWFFIIHSMADTKKPFFTALSDEFEEILMEWGEKIG